MAKRSGLGDQVHLYSEDDGSAREPETFGVDYLETGIIPSIRRGGGSGWGIPFGYFFGVLNLLCLGGMIVFAYAGSPGRASPGTTTSEWAGGAVMIPGTLFALSAGQLVLKALKVPVLQSGAWQVVFTIAMALYAMGLRRG